MPEASVSNGVTEAPDGNAEALRGVPRFRKFRLKNKLLSLDATVIALCVSAFDWAQFRRTKGAVKLHLLL